MKKNSKKGRALVVGSVAYDVLFGVHGTINERIIVDGGVLGRQNMMFTAKMKEQRFGGTGGNIAYGLGMLGVRPILFSAAGRDFAPHFHKHLKANGVDVRVHTEKENWTAMFIGMSDEAREQIGVWQSNAHDLLEKISITDTLGKEILQTVSVAIFCGKPFIALRHMKAVRKILGKSVTIIFDPGQMVAFYSKRQLSEGLSLSDIFIVNDVELKQAEKIFGCSTEDILKLGPRAVIETKGADGSVLYERGKTEKIPAFKPKRVVETTGAGDAYRSGLIYGLLKNLSLAESSKIGAYLGAKNVEYVGGQEYRVSEKDIKI